MSLYLRCYICDVIGFVNPQTVEQSKNTPGDIEFCKLYHWKLMKNKKWILHKEESTEVPNL
jgi:hypothetical protein